MRVLFINTVCGISSTGRICTELAKKYEADGHEVKIAYGRGIVPEQYQRLAIRIGTDMDVCLHGLRTRLLDEHGFGSKKATKEFLSWADSYDPDLLWLHNIHGYYINVEMLFAWIKKRPQMQVKWTLHDCWAFTGHCSYFTMVKCEQWTSHCSYCVQTRQYPASLGIDKCSTNFERKRAAFTGVKNLTLITPSRWLAELAKKSFLKEYPVEVVYNTIDTSVFKPTPSDFREKYGLQDKKVILGVANPWTERKGLKDFLELAKILDDNYAIVLVGLSKKQISQMPKLCAGMRLEEEIQDSTVYCIPCRNEEAPATDSRTVLETSAGTALYPDAKCLYGKVAEICGRPKGNRGCKVICIPKTNEARELAALYTMADLFVDPTHEDNYPTVNLEAKACGTYVVTYDVGGAAETLS